MNLNIQILTPLVLYLFFVFGVAWHAYQKRKTVGFLNEYYVGSRSMGGFVLAMTTVATYVSASSFIGGPGAAYKFGLGWVLLSMIQVPAIWLTLGTLGKKFAMLARQTGSITINDLLFARYQNKVVVWLACISLLLAFFGMMVVQFIGAGRLLETTLGLPYEWSIGVFALVIGLYTFIGGFRAVVLTDTVQGLVMLIGTMLLLGATLVATGGMENAMTTLHAIDPRLLTPTGVDDKLSATFMLSFWVLVCFGLIGLPHTAVRAMAYKDSRSLHRGILVGTVVMTVLVLGMHLAGVLARAVVPELDVPDKVIPTLMMTVLPPFVAGIFLAAPMAAIMSSIDSMLIQSSSTLIKDLYLSIKPDAIHNEAKIKRYSTTLTLGFTMILAVVAMLNPPDMLIWLNLLSFGGLEATFLWVLVFGLYYKKANATGAIWSMAAGLTSYVIIAYFKIALWDLHPVVPALVIGLVAFLVGNKVEEIKKV
ncbi:sodium/pantothenate symporter [Moraxella bovis]|uniref:sodium/pantothenate symporter n=1 Tax=Moraxella bovis TaxID=476 RepID=UPI002226B1BF|nr:sodium/pantothenate symporter [Moraxella bovis]UYZ71909.1 sodium/pantothenate symporter [Moraxella bovis]UYZ72179.1 sodium/pantothenate symporter [Moraxella bovis]UZA15206.1 sodium/pantothenate symporter [Moraxella bovis]UZA26434.1 sodium/pantothenate symporter [Moraxella bovis]UZA39031.1 sodium/pantothenate symporter [Moraxella bovis]